MKWHKRNNVLEKVRGDGSTNDCFFLLSNQRMGSLPLKMQLELQT